MVKIEWEWTLIGSASSADCPNAVAVTSEIEPGSVKSSSASSRVFSFESAFSVNRAC